MVREQIEPPNRSIKEQEVQVTQLSWHLNRRSNRNNFQPNSMGNEEHAPGSSWPSLIYYYCTLLTHTNDGSYPAGGRQQWPWTAPPCRHAVSLELADPTAAASVRVGFGPLQQCVLPAHGHMRTRGHTKEHGEEAGGRRRAGTAAAAAARGRRGG